MRPQSRPAATILRLGTAVAALLALAPAGAGAATNRLINSADPYLRMHAHNPVDWYPWGPAAFAKAKAENKPIFLSIGYSTCYWCHVAEATIYSDPAIAALMNQWFVNVKVDREQRPDVDGLYILATEMLTQNGAWPNNLFLTPDLKPFYAGSYFPPKDDGDTPGFPRVLAAIHDLWENHRADKVEPAADEVMKGLRSIEANQAAASTAPVTPMVWLRAGAADLLKSVDPTNGGLGSAASGPKFPQAPALALFAADARLSHDDAARTTLQAALDGMADGGIHDQLAGGFHRYATEPTWSVPHFEKMLSDNAQLVGLYAAAYALTKDPRDRVIAEDIARYLTRDMAMPGGGFATAQDAETGGVEGATYLWTQGEIEQVLGAADAQRVLAAYELTPMPDSGHADAPKTPGEGVLRLRLPMAETLKRMGVADVPALLAALAPMRVKLLAARNARLQPARDDKIVTSLNGLAISGLARAAIDLGTPDLATPADQAATRIWSTAWDSKTGRLAHQIFEGKAEGDGYLDDYAALGDGLLTLAEATHATAWRDKAATLADAILTRFLKSDGALATSDGIDALPVTLGDNEDADTPSGTSSALDLLGRLGAAPGGDRYADAEAKVAAHLAGRIAAHPTMWPSAIVALADHPPPATASAAAAPPVKLAGPAPTAPGVPSTADHVHASATIASGGDGDTIKVTLTIDPGFHVNAHKPSFDYLVPTDLTFMGLKPSSIAYPPSASFKPSFAKDPLAVYEGDVALVATFLRGALSGLMSVEATVTTQACDASTCLPPATLPVSVVNPG